MGNSWSTPSNKDDCNAQNYAWWSLIGLICAATGIICVDAADANLGFLSNADLGTWIPWVALAGALCIIIVTGLLISRYTPTDDKGARYRFLVISCSMSIYLLFMICIGLWYDNGGSNYLNMWRGFDVNTQMPGIKLGITFTVFSLSVVLLFMTEKTRYDPACLLGRQAAIEKARQEGYASGLKAAQAIAKNTDMTNPF